MHVIARCGQSRHSRRPVRCYHVTKEMLFISMAAPVHCQPGTARRTSPPCYLQSGEAKNLVAVVQCNRKEDRQD